MKIRIRICLLLVFLMHWLTMNIAQQSPLSTLAYKDKYRIMPAYSGMEGTLKGSTVYRNQWQNLSGHPNGIDLSIHFPVFQWGSAFGILIGKDELGLERHTFIKPSFHKVTKINEVLVSAGIQAEFYWSSFQAELARTPEGNYQGSNINHNDQGLSNQKESLSLLDLGLSVYVILHNIEAGISIEKLLQTNHENQPFLWTNQRNLKALCASEFKLLDFKLQTQIVVFTDFVKLQTDLFSGFDYNGSIFGGIHLRGYNGNSLESVGLSLGFSLSRSIQMAYCHEFYIGAIPVNSVSSSQEIGLFYNFGKAFGLGKTPRVIHSPRYSD